MVWFCNVFVESIVDLSDNVVIVEPVVATVTLVAACFVVFVGAFVDVGIDDVIVVIIVGFRVVVLTINGNIRDPQSV